MMMAMINTMTVTTTATTQPTMIPVSETYQHLAVGAYGISRVTIIFHLLPKTLVRCNAAVCCKY